MRILFLTAFYPPHLIGGWEQLVEDINAGLQKRGHITHVLTSTYQTGYLQEPGSSISRAFSLESNLVHYQPMSFFWGRKQRQVQNIRVLENTIDQFEPDIIFVHVMWNLWKGIPWYAEQRLPGKVVYYIADDWPYARNIHENYWRLSTNHGILHLPKQVLGSLALASLRQEEKKYRLRFEHVLCVSNTVRQTLIERLKLNPEQLQVVNNGVETNIFAPRPGRYNRQISTAALELLYVGSLVPAKGVHTAIAALAILSKSSGLGGTRLTLIGSGHPDYIRSLQRAVEENQLGDSVIFLDRIPRLALPELMQKYDVLIFPSTGEALPRVVQEAMASGLAVIGTTTGGTGEILVEGETGLTFAPGDAQALANQIERLSRESELRSHLTNHARELILQQFDLETKIDEIERYLLMVVDQGRSGELAPPPSMDVIPKTQHGGMAGWA